MQIKLNQKIPVVLFLFVLLMMSGMVFVSCEDEYEYDNKEPDFLGASIYDYMAEDGNFSYFLRLVDDLNYKDVLSRTGSKTLFPVKDEAFERFFKANSYGIGSYEDFTPAQKREIMNVSMVNMAYLSYMLANTPNASGSTGGSEGLALRRNTANSYLDSISLIKDAVLFSNPYWERFKENGIYLVDNEIPASIVHFTQPNMALQKISTNDFAIINNGKVYEANGIYINGIRVVERDIICKNGYIHVLEDLLLPAKNMSQIIRDNGSTNLFNKLMNKFCMPYYVDAISKDAHAYYNGSANDRPLIPQSDSIFVKRYFTPDFAVDANGNPLTNYGLLYYDPSDNSYSSQSDMGAMFIPTDDAMDNYLNSNKGRYLKDAYGSWENIPTPVLALFLKNHQKRSFLTALPHEWPTMNDESSYLMNVSADQIQKAYTGSNGVVYVSNAVYPPIDYQCVYGSVLTSNDTHIMNWGIQDGSKGMMFSLYLRSMENMYNLIVPVDEAFSNYRDPLAWAKGVAYREIWSFRYVSNLDQVVADVYSVDESGNKSVFLRELTNQTIIKNRMKDILNMHIVVGEKVGNVMTGYIDDGNTQFTLTKGGATLKISGGGDNTTMTGGGDIEQNISPAEIVTNPSTGRKNVYDSDNGRTYFVDKIIEDPIKSVYTVMGEHPEYTAFFDLLKGDPEVFTYFQTDKDIVSIFDLKRVGATSGLGFVVNSFNNFRYTIFVPTEAALKQAFLEDDKLFTWSEIAAELDHDLKKEKTLYLLSFLKYHFMDNSVYIDGKPFSGMTYETAARNAMGKFRGLVLNGSGTGLEVMNETGTIKANVIKQTGLYNLMARDYIVDNADYIRANNIISSSRSVIHLIDKALRFDN